MCFGLEKIIKMDFHVLCGRNYESASREKNLFNCNDNGLKEVRDMDPSTLKTYETWTIDYINTTLN